jgi:hypothetical protein
MVGKMRLLSLFLVVAMVLSLVAAVVTLPQEVRAAPEPILTVDITAPTPGTTFSVCQYFYVNVTIHNDGPGKAYNIQAMASVDAHASIISTNPLNYPGLNEGWVIGGSFNLHCDELGTSNITVDVTWEDQPMGGNSYGPVSDTVGVEQQNPAELNVQIITPNDGELVGVCQAFQVTARVSNPAPVPGADAAGVEATIDIVGNAALDPATQSATQTVGTGTIPAGGEVDVTWRLHCEGRGDVAITVTATGYDANIGPGAPLSASDNITLHQVKAHLVAEIQEPVEFQNISVCQDISVIAVITNHGDGPATDVRATLELIGDASLTAGVNPQPLMDLWPGDSDSASWTVHCDGPGDVTITVRADGTEAISGNDLRTGYSPPNVDDDTVTIHQVKAHLVADIIEPAEANNFNVCQDIQVTATVTNTGLGSATDVRATLEWVGPASLWLGVNPQPLVDLGPGESDTAYWTMHCDGPGDVTITVRADGTSGRDLRTGFATPNVEDDTVTIHQVKAHLVAQIVEPLDGANFGVCQDIPVTATVTNTGLGSAADVRATLEWVGPAALVMGPNPYPLMDLGPGESDTAYWTMHCSDLGDVTITVRVDGSTSGVDLRTGFTPPNVEDDTVTIHQLYICELWGPEWDPMINPDGWNQISFMVRPDDPDIAVVLDGIKDKVVSVWYYDASTEDWGGTWLSATYDPGTDTWAGDLLTMEDGKGYWIQVTENCTIGLSGTPVVPPEPGPNVPQSYQVYKGWNLVGFSSLTPMPLDEYFFTLYYNDILKEVVWWGSGPWYQWWLVDEVIYDGPVLIMPSYGRAPVAVELQPCQGYWIWVAEDSEIVVPWEQNLDS